MSSEARPAFYALAPGGWRDYVTLLHLPYTTWHLSYVVIGACLAPHVPAGRLALTVAAFFLGLGVGAHALDELNGRPLQTRIPTGVLVALAAAMKRSAVSGGSVSVSGPIGMRVPSVRSIVPVTETVLRRTSRTDVESTCCARISSAANRAVKAASPVIRPAIAK